ncbi:MerR family transcriptional regulator [Rhodococcus sp. G-MC3]|uniref:MerR family transcriptional regulator n=1 Tax=Rhodococcus sp. G-MC3 TaxID=3046209 RepID=UPI0024BA38EF|nr:MerR family transcriptional regulator [Rhodococcus sp. G-MC3]MDJ0396000.1 MerR family transcriptional regulator [Rhodococcus sp. G-MC3]
MIEFRVDDLARRAGVSVRNVRVYQDRGLLPPPRKEGRTGWYNEAHLARLGLITRMLDRGYTFATISELLTAAQSGLRIEDVLTSDDINGAAQQLSTSEQIDRSELEAMFGADLSEADLQRGVDLGVTTKVGDDYRVDNPVLLDAARLLSAAGISLSQILEQTEGVRQDLDDVARRFVALVTDRFIVDGQDPFDTDARTVGEIAELVNGLRPLVHRAVSALLVEAMDRRITSTMEEILAQYGHHPGSANDQAS